MSMRAWLSVALTVFLGAVSIARADDDVPPMPEGTPPYSTIESACTLPANPDPGQDQLVPGRYWNPARQGHGWDLLWFVPNQAQPATALNQKLFVTWYTYRYTGERGAGGGSGYETIWYGATGGVVWDNPLNPTRRIGWDGELWEFHQAALGEGGWGAAPGAMKLDNTGLPNATKVGWIRLAFSGAPNANNPEEVGVWWRFNDDAQQTSVAGNAMEQIECLRNFGNYTGQPPGATSPMDGYTGSWVPDNPTGWLLMSYFYQQFEQQVLLYFEDTGPGFATPRWAHAPTIHVPWPGPEDAHACYNHNYEIGTDPGALHQGRKERCLLTSNGYAPNGDDAPSGGWSANRDQVWQGTLVREYTSENDGRVWILTPDASRGGAGQQLPVNDAGLHGITPTVGPGVPIRKVVNLHRIHAKKIDAPNAAEAEISDGICKVQNVNVNDAKSFCNIKLYWITNQFQQAAVYLRRLSGGAPTNEYILVRDTSPITPIDGYAYPPRGDARLSQVAGGIVVGEQYRFELYRSKLTPYQDPAVSERLAFTGPITGSKLASSVCTPDPAPTPTAIAPGAEGIVSQMRPEFRFSLPSSAHYRIRIYKSPVSGSELFGGEFVSRDEQSGTITAALPAHLSNILEENVRYRWSVQAITPCGAGPPAGGYFYRGVIDIPDAPLTQTAATEASDTAPAVGEVPLEASVDGGAAAVAIPIEVPPGRHGMQPSVALNYSSRGGNGIAGMGWALSGTSAIHRCPRTREQDGYSAGVTLTANDRLCLDGQRLVPFVGTYGQANTQYRTEIDQYLRVTQLGALSDLTVSFKVELKSGEIQWFGSTGESRTVVAKGPTAEQVILAWQIAKREDRAGNTVVHHYQAFGSGETLPSSITYTGDASGEGSRQVAFTYEDRPASSSLGENDRSSTYIAGARVDQTKRLQSVTTRIADPVVRTVRTYTLSYATTAPAISTSQYSARSLLRSVELCAYSANGTNPSCLPKRVMTWQESAPQRRFREVPDLNPIAGQPNLVPNSTNEREPGAALAAVLSMLQEDPLSGTPGGLGSLTPLGDIDGDGTVEVLASRNEWDAEKGNTYALDLVRLRADRSVAQSFPVPEAWAASGLLVYSGNTLDLNNDGRAELWGTQVVQSAPQGNDTPGIYPYRSKLRFIRWTGTSDDWAAGSFQVIETNIWVNTGRKEVISGGSSENLTKAYGPTFLIHFADVNGDALPDLIQQRTPWGPADPWAARCPDDEREDNQNLGGDVLAVHLNTSAAGQLSQIQFEESPSITYCVDSLAPVDNPPGERRRYDSLAAVEDFDGNGMPDLKFDQVGEQPRIHFGERAASSFAWGGTYGNLGSNFEVEMDDLGPDMAPWENPWGATWLDVNGDGLQDILYRGRCTSTNTYVIRLNTGLGGRFNLFGERIRADGNPNASNEDCVAPQGNDNFFRARFAVPGDFDSDGRQELLLARGFAARLCTQLVINDPLPPGSSCPSPTDESIEKAIEPNGGGGETFWFCPEMPTEDALHTRVPQEILGQTACPMYRSGKGIFDDSSYTTSALRFIALGNDAAGRPLYTTALVENTGIVKKAPNGGQLFDLYGDGLDDQIGQVGCRLQTAPGEEPVCIALTPDTPTVPTVPTTADCNGVPNCTWGPSTYPDDTTPADARGLFMSENLGAGAGTAQDPTPLLPELLSRVASSHTAGHVANNANAAQWLYSPLSGRAGRPANDPLPLYTIPARSGSSQGYVDSKHFYFTSSMPVVTEFTETTGLAGFDRLHRFGYEEAMYHNQGRGFRGFRKVIEEDLTAGLVTGVRFHQKFPLIGLEDCRRTTLVSWYSTLCVTGEDVVTSQEATWTQTACADNSCPASPGTPADRIYYQVNRTRVANEEHDQNVPMRETVLDSTFDSFGNVLGEIATRKEFLISADSQPRKLLA